MPEDPEPARAQSTAVSFTPGFRLGLVLEPDGVVREVLEVEGIDPFRAEDVVGTFVGDAAARGRGDQSVRDLWVTWLEHARTQPGPARYLERRDERQDDVMTTVAPIPGPDGQLQSIYVAIHDRSEIIEIKRTAHEHQELLRSTLDVTGLGSFAMYIRERRFDSDERYRAIFGYDPHQEVVDGGVTALLEPLHEDDRERVGATFMRAFKGSEGVTYEEEYRIWARRPGGRRELRRVWVMSRVEVDELGPRRILGVVDDVTDRRREEELRIRMQKREALGTLAGGLAHDFNNVISAILSNAHVAATELKAGADPSTSIAEIARGATRAGELVRRLLDVSRDHEPERRPVDLGAVAADACALLRPTIPPRVKVEIERSEGAPELLGDPSQLHQVVMNLVTNAAQAIGPASGRIHVKVEPTTIDGDAAGTDVGVDPGDYVRLCVKDTGQGIPEHALSRIFDPFFTTKDQGEGTGLGLAAAQSIVRSHGGQITVESQVGSGTTVGVLLPLGPCAASARGDGHAPPPQAAHADGSAAHADGSAAHADGSAAHADGSGGGRSDEIGPGSATGGDHGPARPRVLFVDDEAALTTLAERALPHHGCTVSAFTQPEQALAALSAGPSDFDALVTDLAMPGLSGFELIAAARAVRPDLPVVLTSGFLTDDSQAEAARLAVDRVVPKPCPIDELAAAVHALTNSG